MPAIEFIAIRVPPDMKRWIEQRAEQKGLSLNKTVVTMLKEHKDYHSHLLALLGESEYEATGTERIHTSQPLTA